MTFIKNDENFICSRCGNEVKGNGYTNHCPKCLWSKHVDVDPGDRKETCGGMMEPVRLEGTPEAYRIAFVCQKCGLRTSVKTARDDDTEALIALAQKAAGASM